ncbi:MAG: hypothetical protein JW959_00250 [Pirellulales bacterium]|nr:hypothetical protein [Pirellulales bacterium]
MQRPIGLSILWILISCLSHAGLSAAAEEPFEYFSNPWNVVGLRDYDYGARISPTNVIHLADKRELRFLFGREAERLSRRQNKTVLEGWIPVVMFRADDDAVRYDFKYWATPLPSVKDWRKAFAWPTEGENFLIWTEVTVTNTETESAEAKLVAELVTSNNDSPITKTFTWELKPNEIATAVVRTPFMAVENPSAFDEEDAELWLQRTIGYWKDLMNSAARIEVPCRKATEALRAAHVCQLIAGDHGELHGGEGYSYDRFYIRDGAYQVMELEEAGFWDGAAKTIESYLRHQRPDGRFESQKHQLDANGQAPWALWQYWKITADRAFLERAYPKMLKAAEWTKQARRGAAADSPYAGLLPAAIADGEYLWDGKHHIVGYDFWNLRGILCTIDAARALGKTDKADELQKEADSYRAAIEAAWRKLGIPYFPPSWEKKGTHWGNTETLWPTPLFSPDDPRVAALIDEVRMRHGGGFLEGTIRWISGPDAKRPHGLPDAIHPYMGAYTTMSDLALGNDERVVEDFYWYLLHTSAANAFPEGIYFRTRTAWRDTIPHVTGASNYALMLRHMLIHESGDELHLLQAVPDWWLDEGREIRVERAPTHFGEVSLLVRGTKDGVEVKYDAPKRRTPIKVILRLPRSRPLIGKLEGVEIATRPDQKKRWDYPTVVDLYSTDHHH